MFLYMPCPSLHFASQNTRDEREDILDLSKNKRIKIEGE
jgi:hypothetical protein